MKTRIISGALLICATCGLTACHDDLNVTQPSQLTSRSMWNEESDAETAVNGLYTLLPFNNGRWYGGLGRTEIKSV